MYMCITEGAMQSQNAGTAYFSSKQLLHFGSAEQLGQAYRSTVPAISQLIVQR